MTTLPTHPCDCLQPLSIAILDIAGQVRYTRTSEKKKCLHLFRCMTSKSDVPPGWYIRLCRISWGSSLAAQINTSFVLLFRRNNRYTKSSANKPSPLRVSPQMCMLHANFPLKCQSAFAKAKYWLWGWKSILRLMRGCQALAVHSQWELWVVVISSVWIWLNWMPYK